MSAYDSGKYSELTGYAQDIIDIGSVLELNNAIFVGHSVSSIIGMLASIKRPELFSKLIMIGPSPCYLNHPPKYIGGFEKEQLIGLLDMMEKNYIGWATMFAQTVTNNTNFPEITDDLKDRFCSTDPIIARQFAEATFFSDNRDDLKKVQTPSLILQCSDDIIASEEVGQYMHQHLSNSTLKYMGATGHCPHLSHPEETINLIKDYLVNN